MKSLIRNTTAVVAVCTIFAVTANTALADEKVYQSTIGSTVWVLTPRASGSGFVIDAEKKWVATNYHVIRDHYKVRVVFPQTEKGERKVTKSYYRTNASKLAISARVIRSDPRRDLAILELDRLPAGVKALKLAAKNPAPGAQVHSIGNPGASDALWVYTSGTVRQVYEKTMRMRSGFVVNAKVVETQSPINPGDSGGPVVNDAGELVGVSQSYRSSSRLVSCCIAVNELKLLIAGNNKTVDARVQKIVDDLKLPFTVSVFGNIRVLHKQSDGKTRAIFIGNKSRKFGGIEFREIYTTAYIYPQTIPQEVANALLERPSETPLAAWSVRPMGSRKYIVYSAKIDAGTDAKTIQQLLQSMIRSAESMARTIKRIEDNRKAKAVAAAGPSVIGKWEVVRKSAGTPLPKLTVELNSDKTFQYRLANAVTLRGRYTLVNRQLLLTVGSNQLLRGSVKWQGDALFELNGNVKYTFRRPPARKVVAGK